jgi:hypothetical protein
VWEVELVARDDWALALSGVLLEGEEVTANNRVWPAISLSTTSHSKDLVDALIMFRMLLLGSIVTQSREELDQTKVEDTVEKQHLALYSLLTDQLRHQVIQFDQLTADTFVKNSPGYILLTNFGREEATVDLKKVTHIAESISVTEGGSL